MNSNILGVINRLSYGLITRNLIKALVTAGHPPSLFPINQTGQEFEESEFESLSIAIKNSQFFDVSAPSIRIWHAFGMAESVGRGERIGWPIFELNRFSSLELHHLHSLDRIWVCSDWAKSVCINNGLDNINVVPLGVDTNTFKPNPQYSDVFTIHNLGKLEIRKGHDLIPTIIKKAFRDDDNYKLKMMFRNPIVENVMGENKILEWERYYKENLGNHVDFYPQVQYNSEVAEFLNSSHVGLFPVRAEGWCMPLLESMAVGCHVVTTNYSGHTQYVNSSNAKLVTPSGFEDAHDGVFFNGSGQWATLDDNNCTEFAEHLRYLYDEWKRGNLQQNTEGIKTAEVMTWDNTVKVIESFL